VLDAIATHWDKSPVVLRGALPIELIPEAAILEALRSELDPLKVFAGKRRIAQDPRILPLETERAMGPYLARLTAEVGDDIGMTRYALQLGSDALWREITRLLFDLFARFGIPLGGMSATGFFGNYRRSLGGVHKDGGHVVTVVVHGKKRMLLWPYDELRHHAGEEIADGELKSYSLEVPLSDVRATAIVIDAAPGDVMYWPPSYWHCAESDGEPTATITFGSYPSSVARPAGPFEMAARAAERAFEASSFAGFQPFASVNVDHARAANDAADQLLELTARLLASDEVHDEFLRWRSSFGMIPYPEIIGNLEVDPDDTIEIDLPCRLLHRERKNGQLAIAAGGHVLECEPRYLALLDQLQVGTVRVADLVRRTPSLTRTEIIDALGLLASRRAFVVRKA
jgi:hypothetical protein